MTFRPKLVRDKIPDIIKKTGKQCRHSALSDAEYSFYLIEKLKEETEEFAESPCLEEAADIYEVFLAMLENWSLRKEDVETVAALKKEDRGGFTKRILLERINSETNT